MKLTGSACSLLLLSMAAVSSARNATEYFREARFQRPPSKPEDALVFFVGDVPPLICQPYNDVCLLKGSWENSFCLGLPHGFSLYDCWFDGNTTVTDNLKRIENRFPDLFDIVTTGVYVFSQKDMHCTSTSQLPDEYFQLKVQRPHEEGPVKCRFESGKDKLYLRFTGYPTVVCRIGKEVGRYSFRLPCIDEGLKCAFRVYSELPLGDTSTEQRLYRSLLEDLPSRQNDTCPRFECSRKPALGVTSHFQLQLHYDATYNCRFSDAVPRYVTEASTEKIPHDDDDHDFYSDIQLY